MRPPSFFKALPPKIGRSTLVFSTLALLVAGSLTASSQELDSAGLEKARSAFEAEKAAILNSLRTESALEAIAVRSFRQPFRSGEVWKSVDGILDKTLDVRYAENPIWSVKDNRDLKLYHRSYEGTLVGPTLRVRPGEMLRVLMTNSLPDNTGGGGGHGHGGGGAHGHSNEISPKRFNITNLHTHGLHVSPAGNSDNVLIEINPGKEFQNEIYIPRDHPPGTFWYHAHVHGSTAIQVSSGMAGALIVEGGLDDVPEITAAKEKIFVFQQITHHPDADDPGRVVVEDFDEVMGFGVWAPKVAAGEWRTTINGQTIPVISMQPGEVQRWRFVHGGVRESIDVQLEGHEVWEIAADGLAFGKKVKRDSVMLNPGYRSDVLVKANPAPDGKPVTAFLIDRETPAEDAVLAEPEPPNVLAVVVISGPALDMAFPDDAALAPLKPFPSIADDELEGDVEKVKFDIGGGLFTVNGVPFDPSAKPRQLKLGSASEWELTSGTGSHPFHIHVNPFEIVEMWNDEDEKVPFEPVWKDTILVKSGWKIRVRSRYQRYIGTFVLHCHILDHEDQGMMQLVEIVP